MFDKVNPGHPDKMADRLAGAVVDLVYERAGGLTKANPRVACEVMAGHGRVDEKEGVETPDDDSTNTGNQGGNNNPPSGELEG